MTKQERKTVQNQNLYVRSLFSPENQTDALKKEKHEMQVAGEALFDQAGF